MKKQINLNPKVLKNKRSNLDLEVLIILLIVFLVGLGGYTAFKYIGLYTLNKNESALETTVNNLKIGNENIGLKNQIESKEKEVDYLESVSENYNSYKYLNEINKYIPAGITITTVTLQNGLMNVQGSAINERDVDILLQNLKQSTLYSNCNLDNMGKVNLTEKNNKVKQDTKIQKVKTNAIPNVKFSISIGGKLNGKKEK